MTCYACQWPTFSLAAADPLTVVADFDLTASMLEWTAPEQRANLEHARRCLCDKHAANYEAVIEALETALQEVIHENARTEPDQGHHNLSNSE